ncbi:MAG: hypothetical protein H0V89_05455, partial [Deltaproteobacteria bacterium]|nr:hypothetical protein [Deltaproteobacteria bacterium]
MSQTGDARSTKDLFKDWRQGDAGAGQLMAQRFADWYYAIATSRLGEGRGRRPCEVACQKFGDGIVKVSDGRKLIPWAHEIIKGELDKAGQRVMDGDEPNAYTNNQAPKGLLARARADLPAEVTLLEACYGGRASAAEIEQLAGPLGGNPLGVLRARYRVKQWLRDRTGVPFDVAPDQPVLDRAPLPLYESGRMATMAEEDSFEQWMISDLNLCRDIAEFAQFAIALRGGVPAVAPRPSQSLGRAP